MASFIKPSTVNTRDSTWPENTDGGARGNASWVPGQGALWLTIMQLCREAPPVPCLCKLRSLCGGAGGLTG